MSHAASLRLTYETLAARGFLPSVVVLFAVSGFAGLIYESIWSHYLKLFLGHAAYAQTAGACHLHGRDGHGRVARQPDLAALAQPAACVRGGRGADRHRVARVSRGIPRGDRIRVRHRHPRARLAARDHAFKWTLAALLILPQSVLLGMTFPLMTGGRAARRAAARRATPSPCSTSPTASGAGVGVLASGFYLIPTAGLPGTLLAAAVLNLAVAAARCPAAAARAGAVRPASADATPSGARREACASLLVVAALTGMSSFMYEIGWIRMLSLVLGSSTHAFELMLSAFILGTRLRWPVGAPAHRLRRATPCACSRCVQVAMGARRARHAARLRLDASMPCSGVLGALASHRIGLRGFQPSSAMRSAWR